jgi:aquaporin Z
MWQALSRNWRIYLIEAWALGSFMLSASLFALLIKHPDFPLRAAVPSELGQRALVGIAMGLTAVLLIYSPWGKRSGAHMNPAVTLSYLQLERIRPEDAFWYIAAQFSGSAAAMLLLKALIPGYLASPEVDYVLTRPGEQGPGLALMLEALMAFTLFLTVLFSSNQQRLAPYTGYLAGTWIFLFITFEAPFSGMSMNPARTSASALSAGVWEGSWIYFVGPVGGMQLAAWLYRRAYRLAHGGNCLTMRCHMSGAQHDNPTYEVLGPTDLLNPS